MLKRLPQMMGQPVFWCNCYLMDGWAAVADEPLFQVKICCQSYADALFAGAGIVDAIVRYIGGVWLCDLEYTGSGFTHLAQSGLRRT